MEYVPEELYEHIGQGKIKRECCRKKYLIMDIQHCKLRQRYFSNEYDQFGVALTTILCKYAARKL